MSQPTEHDSSNPLFLHIAGVGLLVAVVCGLALPLLWRTREPAGPSEQADAARRLTSADVFRALSGPDERLAEVERIIAAKQRNALPILQGFARRQGDLEFRLACIRALGAIGEVGEAHTLSVLAESHIESRQIRLVAIAALGEMEQPYPLSYLSVVLTKEDTPLRLAAVEALAQRDSSEAVAMVAGAIGDDSKEVRTAAVAALAARETAETTDALIAALRSPYPNVRMATVKVLSRRDGPQVQAALAQAASDKDATVQAAAIKAVRGADAEAIDSIIDGAGRNASVAARLEIARAIHRGADAKHATALLRLLNDLRPHRNDGDLLAQLPREVYEGVGSHGPGSARAGARRHPRRRMRRTGRAGCGRLLPPRGPFVRRDDRRGRAQLEAVSRSRRAQDVD